MAHNKKSDLLSNSIFNKDKLANYYRVMLLIRRFEEKAAQLYGMGQIAGFCHLYIGQEAVVTGIQGELQKDDMVITTYRDHGHMLAKEIDPGVIMAELLGKATGCSKGKGGSMHMFDVEKKFYGGHGIVGVPTTLGTGLAFAAKYKDNKDIAVTYFGDGSINQGQVYESFNMAALWKLPVLYVIENNEYAMGTSLKRSTSISDLYKRGESFGISGVQVDGMNVLEVAIAARKAIDYIRAGNGPTIIEVKTYRYRGHSMSDPGLYRSKEEVEKYKTQRDPIEQIKNLLLENNIIEESWFKEVEKDIKAKVQKAIDFAQNSPDPDPSELYTDVYL